MPDEKYSNLRDRFTGAGQGHLFAFWEELNPDQQGALLDDLMQLDIDLCRSLIDSHVKQRPNFEPPGGELTPPHTYSRQPTTDQQTLYQEAREHGQGLLRAGKVAAFTVAGGQGTRLGFEGPKGAFPISPIRDATLFQLFAEYLLGIERVYRKRPRWYIMTSPLNHDATTRFFEQHGYFGLSADDVMFFPQGQMPAFMPDGRIALANKHRIALSPDGHGGSLKALRTSGALTDMAERGIEHISYFQVDNPLVHAVDPLFIGLHAMTGSEMSSKAVHKAHDFEKVGVFCATQDTVRVIEYSDLPEELATAKNPDGSRKFDAGSIAIHALRRDFVERLTDPGSPVSLPWHRADKKVPCVDPDTGEYVEPAEPNAVKVELFVFDAVPLAENALVLYTDRAEEFSPVKNAHGDDSPATARRDLQRRAARWLEHADQHVPRDPEGEPVKPLEISPGFAVDADDLANRLRDVAQLDFSQPLLLK